MKRTVSHDERVAKLVFAAVYPHLLAKVEKKGRTREELHQVITWLTGYSEKELQALLESRATYEQFFQQARLVDTRGWRLLYALGLILGALAWWLWRGAGVAEGTQVPWWLLLAGGFVAGYGARLGNGCTSGHGICGLGSLQWPSALAVLTFMATAFITANLVTRWIV